MAEQVQVIQKPKSVLTKLVVSLLAAGGLFFVMSNSVQKAANPFGTVDVYKVKDKVEANAVISTDAEFDKYFSVVKSFPKDKAPKNAILEKKDVIGKQINSNLYAGEIVVADRVSDVNKNLVKIENSREINIKFADFTEGVGGTLREGDSIDILCTYKGGQNTETTTETKIQSIYVSKAFTSDGLPISRSESTYKPSNSVNLITDAKSATIIASALQNGKISILKVLDGSKYETITIKE